MLMVSGFGFETMIQKNDRLKTGHPQIIYLPNIALSMII